VLGPIDTAELGLTLMHEHVFTLTPDSQQQQWTDEWDEETKVAEAIETLRSLRATGVKTIADPTVDGLGRNVPRVLRINQQVPDLNILVATGVYTFADVPGFFRARGSGVLPDMPDVMTPYFVRDLTQGIQGTPVKAAFLKCAIDHHGMTAGVERVLRACAQAALEAHRPLMVHTHPRNQTGLLVQKGLTEEGLSPERVQLAHSGDSTVADHLSQLADAGFLLGMDRFGIDFDLPFDERVGIVVEMCRRGYAGSMVLSQDAACYIDWVAPELMPLMPNWHFQHVLRDVVPALLERGVTQDQVDQMLVGNPRRFFET
jgi:phosphotriesterase-related protein